MEDQAIGKVLAGKYRIDGFLKRGGMGAVYRGTHLMLDKPVAIKLIKPELVTSEDTVKRFQREARAASQLASGPVPSHHKPPTCLHNSHRRPGASPFLQSRPAGKAQMRSG